MITLLIISIIVLLAGLWFWKHGYELFLNEQELNKAIEEENDRLEKTNQELNGIKTQLDEKIENLKKDIKDKLNETSQVNENLTRMKDTIYQAFLRIC